MTFESFTRCSPLGALFSVLCWPDAIWNRTGVVSMTAQHWPSSGQCRAVDWCPSDTDQIRCVQRLVCVRPELPSEHDTLTQCWVNVGAPSPASPQHSPSIGSMYRVCWLGVVKWCPVWLAMTSERATSYTIQKLDTFLLGVHAYTPPGFPAWSAGLQVCVIERWLHHHYAHSKQPRNEPKVSRGALRRGYDTSHGVSLLFIW